MNNMKEKLSIPLGLLKKCIQIISDFCALLVILYLIFFIPMIIGYKMLVMKDDHKDIKAGTLLYYQKIDPNLLANNDLIVYQDGETYKIRSIHRVESPKDSSSEYSVLINLDDGQVQKKEYSEILGKVAGVKISYIGFYIDYMNHHKILFYTLIAIVIGDIVVGNIITTIKDKKRKKVS